MFAEPRGSGGSSGFIRSSLSSSLLRGAVPLKHSYSLNLPCSSSCAPTWAGVWWHSYSRVSQYSVTSDTEILRGAAAAALDQQSCSSPSGGGVSAFTLLSDGCVSIRVNKWKHFDVCRTPTYLPASSFLKHDLKVVNLSSTRKPCVCVCACVKGKTENIMRVCRFWTFH